MNRSVSTHVPRERFGLITLSTCSARSAAKSRSSARDDFFSPLHSSRSFRISIPSGVPPGSRVSHTECPLATSFAESRLCRVVFPHPLMPSKAMKAGDFDKVNCEDTSIREQSGTVTGWACTESFCEMFLAGAIIPAPN